MDGVADGAQGFAAAPPLRPLDVDVADGWHRVCVCVCMREYKCIHVFVSVFVWLCVCVLPMAGTVCVREYK